MPQTLSAPHAADPAQRYRTPEALAQDETLPLERRIRILSRWQVLRMQKERAARAGMPHTARTSLRAVSHALRRLKEEHEKREGADGQGDATTSQGTRSARPIGTLLPLLATAAFTVGMIVLLFIDATPLAFAAAGVGVFATAVLWIALRRMR